MTNHDLQTAHLLDRIAPFVVLILTIPLFFLNMETYPGWGGDFALYINQAIHIADGLPQKELGYIYNPFHPGLSPIVYPVGWPLLIAPVYTIFGFDIYAIQVLSAALLAISGLIFYYLFRVYVPTAMAIAGALLIVYHPQIADLKGWLLSEIPFVLFLTATISLYIKGGIKRNPVLLTTLLTFALLTRSIGVFLCAAIFISEAVSVYRAYKKGNSINLRNSDLLIWTIISTVAVLTVLFITNVILDVPTHGGYFDQIRDQGSHGTGPAQSIPHYLKQLHKFYQFLPESILTQGLKYILLFLTIVGIFVKSKKTVPLAIPIFCILYFIGVSMFPYLQGVRHFYVILPLLMLYTLIGFNKIKFQSIYLNNAKWILIVTALGVSYFTQISNIETRRQRVLSSPSSPLAMRAWSAVKELTPQDAVFTFSSPRVFSLYAERQCIHHGLAPPEQVHDILRSHDVGYIMINDWREHPQLDSYLELYSDSYELIWEEKRFHLLRYTGL